MTTFRGVVPLALTDPSYAAGYRYVVATAEVTIAAPALATVNAAAGGGAEDDVTLEAVTYTAARTASEGEAQSLVLGSETLASTETATFQAVAQEETEGRRIVHITKSLTPPGAPGALLFKLVHYGLVGDVFTPGEATEVDDGPLVGPGGLAADYFSNRSFTGLPAYEVVENVDISRGEQVSTIDMEDYSARWVGYIRAPETGNYRFRLQSDGRGRVTLGENIYIDDWGDNKKRVTTGPVKALVAGEDTFIKVETANPALGWECQLYWELPSAPGVFVLVPASVMYSGLQVTITPPRQTGASHYVQSVNRYLEA